ncbi:facilitated trehalose transporter Tret1-like [Phymastichus coffea]|uniref:facilitated trehalose transporter Tret1-like n=1 Tax=Phymastichus coffea TaxID=108790 RepID=UPI00273C88D0|nr:facilitated trehalose transporter Tret1-like [Phymastichus coffea]
MGSEAEKGKYASPEGNRTWEYLATFACSILMFCIGSSMGWNSPASVKLTEPPLELTSVQVSTLMSIIAIGQTLAPPLNSVIVDRIGRKNTILITGLPMIVSWTLMITAQNIWVLYVARFAAGLSQGIGYCVCGIYVGEVASHSSRGMANVLVTIMFNLGMLMGFAVGTPLSIRQTACLNLALVSLFELVFWFMPESPYYLLMAKQHDEAEAVLVKLHGKCEVGDEIEAIERSLKSSRKLAESQSRTSAWTLLSGRATARAILIVGLFSFSHHFGGYTAVITYGQKIFKDLQVAGVSDHLASVINGLVQLVSVGLTTFIVDRWGRKPLIAMSGVSAGLCNLVIGLYFYFKEYTTLNVSGYSLLPMIAVFLVVFAFNCGLLIVQTIFISELFAPEVKALGVCLVITNGGLMFTASTKLYLTVAETWGYGHSPPFLGFMLVTWTVTAALLKITPETKGKTLHDIQQALME